MCERNIDLLPLEVASHMCLSWGPGPKPRNVPRPRIELVTFHFLDDTQPTKPHQSGLFLHVFALIETQQFENPDRIHSSQLVVVLILP